MRIAASFVLLAPLCLAACSDDKDPLDGLTVVPDTSGDATSTDGPATTTNNGSNSDSSSDSASGATTSASGDSATATTGDPPETTASTVSTTTAGPTTSPATSATTTTGDPVDPYEQARQLCVDTINMYRGTLGLPPYQRWVDAESCSDDEAASDGQTGTPHGAFGMCGEFAQNECPGWPSPPEESLPGCLAQMWAEGPGEDFNTHGHYINMSSEQYTMVSCGFADVGGGEMWMVQNFR